MARENIATIGFSSADEDIDFLEFDESNSLLDYDIVLFRPDISPYAHSSDTYNGKPCLPDDQSFRLRGYMEHWQREIKEAVDAGKTVIVFMTDKKEISIGTGEKQYSGTGRNSRITRIVADYDNYQFLPVNMSVVPSIGTSMSLSPSGVGVLNEYWKEFGVHSNYKLILNINGNDGLIHTRNGKKSVGAMIRSKHSNGAIILRDYPLDTSMMIALY